MNPSYAVVTLFTLLMFGLRSSHHDNRQRTLASVSPEFVHQEFIDSVLKTQMDDGSFTSLIIPSSALYNIHMIFLYEYLGLIEGKEERVLKLIQFLFGQQKENGAFSGHSKGADDLGISIGAYIAGKIGGLSEEDSRMLKLEKFINKKEGNTGNILVAPYLVLFSLYPIRMTFNSGTDKLILLLDDQLPWIKVMLHPLLYLIDNGHRRLLGADKYPGRIFKESYKEYASRVPRPIEFKKEKFHQWAQDHINDDGTFFDYTPTSIPMLMALHASGDDYSQIVTMGVSSLENFQLEVPRGGLIQTPGEASVGETFYMANALLNVGLSVNAPAIKNAETYLLSRQLKSGGWGFSKNSKYFPDSDDTAIVMGLLARIDQLKGKKGPRPEIRKALQWLLRLQNSNGGFGTWDKTELPILGRILNWVGKEKGIVMSESVLEHTARIVYTLSLVKEHFPEAQEPYERAYKWIMKQQKKDGSFVGTWFIGSSFGTSMVLSALGTDVTKEKHRKAITKAIEFIKKQQFLNGGFGESPESFILGQNVFLPTASPAQTGLIISLLSSFNRHTSCLFHSGLEDIFHKGNEFLSKTEEQWTNEMDPTWTGVTFPKIEYLIYQNIQKIAPWEALNLLAHPYCP